MKTLILNGSPRKQGDTAAMLAALELPGEVVQIDTFWAKVSPCMDCRWCRTHEGCCIRDEMQEVYRLIGESDRIIIASPVWFETLPGPLLTLASRLQCYFSAGFFQKKPKLSGKKGAVILAAGGTGQGGSFRVATLLLRQMGVEGEIPLVISPRTDDLPAAEDTAALEAIKNILKEP
ncbi:MAG: flavodoxin family protein [Clostridia bacterium]|nr:flavodoxin family protein [Clostridia bacterium]